jgi:GT2 family glycosyltransferase
VTGDRPLVSLIIPAYRSQETIAGCLEALRRQTFRSFETLVVDSSLDDATGRIVTTGFAEVRYDRAAGRLLPHAARNRGAAAARGDVLVFTDPDVYARPDWLERLVDAHRRTGPIVVGAVACHGRRWRDVGIHLCKFAAWLPGGPPRVVDNAPTVNLLCTRAVFAAVGPFPGDRMAGDTVWSWRARARGLVLPLAPDAVVHHHHLETVGAFLRERYRRGVQFAAMRGVERRHRRRHDLALLLASALPVRLARVLALTVRHAARSGLLADLAWTLPLVLAGHAAGLLGETQAYARRLFRPGADAGLPPPDAA